MWSSRVPSPQMRQESGFDSPVPRVSTRTRSRSARMGEWATSGAPSAAPSPGPPERKKTGSGARVGPVAGRRTIRKESFRPERVSRFSKTSYVPHRASPPLSGKVQGESLPCHLRDMGAEAGAGADADAAGEMALGAAGAWRAVATVAARAAATVATRAAEA